MTWSAAIAYLAIGLVLGLLLGRAGFGLADMGAAWWQGRREGRRR